MGRRSFSREFKVSAVRLVQEQGYTATEAAKSLGVEPASIRDWLKKFSPETGGGTNGESAMRAELRRLREENKRLTMEREILKKRRPSSPSSSHEVRLHARPLATVPPQRDESRVAGIAQRLLRLAAAAT